MLHSGTLPWVYIQSTCRCPPSHPRLNPTRTNFCLKTGVPDNSGTAIGELASICHASHVVLAYQ